MQVKEPVSFTVLMRMSRVPLAYTKVLEELDTSLPSGEIQWMTGSGSPLALHLERDGGKPVNKQRKVTKVSGKEREREKH